MILLIDNYDSFTWNLVNLLHISGAAVTVYRNDAAPVADLLALAPEGIVISPGPGRPQDSGLCPDLLRAAFGRIPVLGVCLGHQLIGEMAGARLVHGREPVHGKTAAVYHSGQGVFAGLPDPVQVMRYHSLLLDTQNLPASLEVTARTAAGEIMGIRHRTARQEGVQFHPESILTVGGEAMVRNWLAGLAAGRV